MLWTVLRLAVVRTKAVEARVEATLKVVTLLLLVGFFHFLGLLPFWFTLFLLLVKQELILTGSGLPKMLHFFSKRFHLKSVLLLIESLPVELLRLFKLCEDLRESLSINNELVHVAAHSRDCCFAAPNLKWKSKCTKRPAHGP